MRTNIELGALSPVESADMMAVEGGGVLAVSNLTGTAISKYLGEIEDRLSPDYDFSEPRVLDQPRLYP